MGRLKCGRAVQDEIAPEDLERIRTFIAGHRWVFAKTMPHWPHWYTLRKEAQSDEEFLWLVAFIRDHGYDERFREIRHLYLSGHRRLEILEYGRSGLRHDPDKQGQAGECTMIYEIGPPIRDAGVGAEQETAKEEIVTDEVRKIEERKQ